MAGRGIHYFMRVVLALIIGVVVSIGSLPDTVRDGLAGEFARNHDHPESTALAGEVSLNDLEICHVGLDCMTVAIVRKTRTPPAPKQTSFFLIWEFERLDKDRWAPQMTLPPPRRHS